MLRQASESEKILTRRLRQMIRADAQEKHTIPWAERPSDNIAPYEVKFLEGPNSPFFLVKDQNGEIFEVEINGNIDPGAWEDL